MSMEWPAPTAEGKDKINIPGKIEKKPKSIDEMELEAIERKSLPLTLKKYGRNFHDQNSLEIFGEFIEEKIKRLGEKVRERRESGSKEELEKVQKEAKDFVEILFKSDDRSLTQEERDKNYTVALGVAEKIFHQ